MVVVPGRRGDYTPARAKLLLLLLLPRMLPQLARPSGGAHSAASVSRCSRRAYSVHSHGYYAFPQRNSQTTPSPPDGHLQQRPCTAVAARMLCIQVMNIVGGKS